MIAVQVTVRFPDRELQAAEEAASRNEVIAALNRARDQMLFLLARNGIASKEQGRPHSQQERADDPDNEGA